MPDENQNSENPFANFKIDPPKINENQTVTGGEAKSNEVKQTQEEAREVVDSIVLDSNGDNPFEEEFQMPESFSEELFSALSQAGITKKSIFVFLAFLAAIIYGIYYLFVGQFGLFSGNDSEVEENLTLKLL